MFVSCVIRVFFCKIAVKFGFSFGEILYIYFKGVYSDQMGR